MENAVMPSVNNFDWTGIVGLLIIAGIFGYGNWGMGGNARNDISNEFLYNQMANDIRANGQAIATTDRDVLTTGCNTDKEILESRYTTQLGFQSQAQQMCECCNNMINAVHSEGEATRALIQANTIQDLRDKIADKDREALATGLSYSTSLSVRNAKDDILNSLGNYYPRCGVNPLYVYGYNYGTTIQ